MNEVAKTGNFTSNNNANSISSNSGVVGPMSKIADISRKLASLGILLNNATNTDDISRLNDTLETVEQLLESLEYSGEGKKKIYYEETIHTRPLIGTAMRIINVYEAIFCVLAASLLLSVIILH